MIGAGIHSGDLLIVDRAVTATHNSVIIAVLNGDLTVKRLYQVGGTLRLMPENPAYPPIEICPGTDFEVWGVVTKVIHFL
jgi:DNA polymerase V